MKLKDWLNVNREVFAQRDLNFLMSVLMDRKSAGFTDDCALDDSDMDYLLSVKNLYSEGYPIAYILRQEQFFGLDFFVEPGVLIPRPETEIITEEALDIVNKNSINFVLDLCCGISCIAIVIAKHANKSLNIFASDISRQALMVSRKNIDSYNVPVRLIRSDLFSGFRKESFDLIVANPPYVETDYIKGSLSFEPRIALDGRSNGFYFIEKILRNAHKYLKSKGYLIVEIGYNHRGLLNRFIENTGIYDIVKWIKDYSSYTRGVILRLK